MPAVWELIAISDETERVWRWRAQGGQTIRLGRCPGSGWAAPWDRRISSEHADLHFEVDHVRVVRLEKARNSIHSRGVTGDEFCLRTGQEFRIGNTTFRVYLVSASEVATIPTTESEAWRLLRQSDLGSSARQGAALRTTLEVALELIDQSPGTSNEGDGERPTETVEAPHDQESTTRSPEIFARLLVERSESDECTSGDDGGESAPADGQLPEQVDSLRDKISSLEDAWRTELSRRESEEDARRAAEQRIARVAEESARRLADAEQRREAEEQLRHESDDARRRAESELQELRTNAEAAQIELARLRGAIDRSRLPHQRDGQHRPAAEDEFDPYYQWLAIPPAEQPPDHYRLLGLSRFETNLEIIEYAADRQMEFVRRQQSGKRARLSQRLLNELSRARICLRDPVAKRQYDERLWAEIEAVRPSLVISTQKVDTVSRSLDGTALRDYELLDYVTETRHGHVFKALHRSLRRLVAIAVLTDAAARVPQLADRFRLKAVTLSRARHPAYPTAYDAGQQQDLLYLVTEFLEGRHLVRLIQQQGPLPIERGVNYIAQAAAALHYLHELGIIHRNVKPSHLMLGDDHTIRVIGLGSCLHLNGEHTLEVPRSAATLEPWQIGSPDYMAPEQAEQNQGVDRRADVYSLGCTLFTLLTRRLIFPVEGVAAKLRAHREQLPPLLVSLRTDVPRRLDEIFQRMVSKSPEARFATLAEVVAALREAGFDGAGGTK